MTNSRSMLLATSLLVSGCAPRLHQMYDGPERATQEVAVVSLRGVHVSAADGDRGYGCSETVLHGCVFRFLPGQHRFDTYFETYGHTLSSVGDTPITFDVAAGRTYRVGPEIVTEGEAIKWRPVIQDITDLHYKRRSAGLAITGLVVFPLGVGTAIAGITQFSPGYDKIGVPLILTGSALTVFAIVAVSVGASKVRILPNKAGSPLFIIDPSPTGLRVAF